MLHTQSFWKSVIILCTSMECLKFKVECLKWCHTQGPHNSTFSNSIQKRIHKQVLYAYLHSAFLTWFSFFLPTINLVTDKDPYPYRYVGVQISNFGSTIESIVSILYISNTFTLIKTWDNCLSYTDFLSRIISNPEICIFKICYLHFKDFSSIVYLLMSWRRSRQGTCRYNIDLRSWKGK